jgi:hypothetical protein
VTGCCSVMPHRRYYLLYFTGSGPCLTAFSKTKTDSWGITSEAKAPLRRMQVARGKRLAFLGWSDQSGICLMPAVCLDGYWDYGNPPVNGSSCEAGKRRPRGLDSGLMAACGLLANQRVSSLPLPPTLSPLLCPCSPMPQPGLGHADSELCQWQLYCGTQAKESLCDLFSHCGCARQLLGVLQSNGHQWRGSRQAMCWG